MSAAMSINKNQPVLTIDKDSKTLDMLSKLEKTSQLLKPLTSNHNLNFKQPKIKNGNIEF